MQNKGQVQSTLRSDSGQKLPSVICTKISKHNNHPQAMDHNDAQQPTMRPNSTDTKGFTCTILKDTNYYTFLCMGNTSTHFINFKDRYNNLHIYLLNHNVGIIHPIGFSGLTEQQSLYNQRTTGVTNSTKRNCADVPDKCKHDGNNWSHNFYITIPRTNP